MEKKPENMSENQLSVSFEDNFAKDDNTKEKSSETEEIIEEYIKPKKEPKNKLEKIMAYIAAPFDNMHHIGTSFILSAMILALIYVAMEVWPFGKSSILVLDMNGQYISFFEQMRDILHGENGFLYSFERSTGGEFLGIIAYYVASPFTFLVSIFPEKMITEAVYLIFILKCGLSGMNMCVYLHKSHPTKPINEIIFSVLYALTSYAVVLHHNTMWMDCYLFLPLILLGIESLIKYRKYKLFTLTLAVSVFSSFYIGYMVCIFVAIYFFFCFIKYSPSERNPLGESRHFLKSLGRIALFSAIAVGMAAVILLPAVYSLEFGKSTFSNPNFSFEQNFDFLDLIAKMLPGSYDSVDYPGLPFVYTGMLTLFMLPIFFLSKEIASRKKIAYGLVASALVFSFNLNPLDLVWHGFQAPNWLNYRYAFMYCFIVIVMAYLAFEHIEKIDYRAVIATGGGIIILIFVLQKFDYEFLYDFYCIWFSIICAVLLLMLLSGCNKRWLDGAINTVLCIFVLFELFCSGLVNTVYLGKEVSFSSRSSYRDFIDKWTPIAEYINKTDTSFYRAEKTGYRKYNDNFALNLNGISISTSTLNKSQIAFLKKLGYSSKSHWSRYLGGTPVSDSLLGLKYILAEDDDTLNSLYGSALYEDTENGTVMYRNEYALPVAYTVSEKLCQTYLEDLETPFEYMNYIVGAMIGESEPVELFKPYKTVDMNTDNIDITYTSGHKEYAKKNSGYTGKITWDFTVKNDYEIFVYFPSDYMREVSLKLNGEDYSEYFTKFTDRILSLGYRTKGEELYLSMTLEKEQVYIKNGYDYFWYLDEALFEEIMPRLISGGYNIESYTDSSFKGTVSVDGDDKIFLFTVPYDEGWKIYCDGERLDSFEVLDSLTAIKLDSGEHRIEMYYRPDCFYRGVTISIVSILAFALIVCLEFRIYKKKSVVNFNAEQ